MRQIENTPLSGEVFRIIGNKNSQPEYVKRDITLHTNDLDIPIYINESLEILRDYNGNISDYIVATFMLDMGDYIKDIHPFRDNLELSIVTKENGSRTITRYKFIILNNKTGIDGSRYTNSTRDELNKLEKARIVGQCVNRTVEALMSQTISGVIKNSNVSDAIRAYINIAINKVKINGTLPEMDVNISPVDNERIYDHIVVPTGHDLLNVASYIQSVNYGVYNGGMGTYIQKYDNDTIFVYPLFSNNLFDTSTKKLVIYSIYSVKFEMVENTYLVDGDVVKIISGGSTRSYNNDENDVMDTGIGYTQTDPNKLLNSNNTVSGDTVSIDSDSINHTNAFKYRNDGNDKIKYVGATDNLYSQRTEIIKNTMMVYQIQWNHCNPDLLYPGMPVIYNYTDEDNGVIKLRGTLQSVYVMYNEGLKTVTSLINIAVEKPYFNTKNTMKDNSKYEGRV